MSRRKGRTTVFRQNIPAVNIITQTEVQTTVNNSINDAFSNMAGIVFAYAGTTPPPGWLLCNGQAVSRTVYANLFARIGTAHGAGDGVTTFNLPDYRGRFLRGVDGGAGRDPDRGSRFAMNTGGNTGDNVGSLQGHAFQSHTHSQYAHRHSYGVSGSPPAIAWTGGSYYLSWTTNQTDWTTAVNMDAGAYGANSQATYGETRPVNAYVNYIIKT